MLPIIHLRSYLLLLCIIYSVKEHFHTANNFHFLFWVIPTSSPLLGWDKQNRAVVGVGTFHHLRFFPERCRSTLAESCVVQVCTSVVSWSSCSYLWTQNLRVPLPGGLCLALLKGTSWTLHMHWLTVTDEVGCDIPLAAPQHKQWEHNKSSHLPHSLAPPKLKVKWRPGVIHIFIQNCYQKAGTSTSSSRHQWWTDVTIIPNKSEILTYTRRGFVPGIILCLPGDVLPTGWLRFHITCWSLTVQTEIYLKGKEGMCYFLPQCGFSRNKIIFGDRIHFLTWFSL